MGLGSAIGGLLGGLGSKIFPIPGVKGDELGSFLGGFLPFQAGGVVPGQRVFNTGQMVVRKPRRTYQKSSGRKSRRKK